MSRALITESYLTGIANAIRAKLGVQDTYTPPQMAAAIESIHTGGITPTGTVNISQNGTHDVTQYASANVNVQPNLQSKTATENGTVTPDQGYDGLSSVLVNVSGGLPSAYKNLIEEASIMFGHQVFDGTAGYCIRTTSVPSAAPIPTGITACSVEVYFNCTASGYIIGFGNMATRQVFSFTPEIFVSYADDHRFSNSYMGENHLVAVYDGGTTVYIYANGSLAETFQLSGTINIGVGYFFQGQWAATSESLFRGTIYHTAVWKRALTPTEVATLYQNRNSISEPDQI